jgi:hypothetical protein
VRRILVPIIEKGIVVDQALEIFMITNEDIYGESKNLFDLVLNLFGKRGFILNGAAENHIPTLQVGRDVVEIQGLVKGLKVSHSDGFISADVDAP